MNNTGDKEIGGASIIPSARPSIHSHYLCPFAYGETMGRYGLERNKQEQGAEASKHITNQSNDQGADEVDNVFSKPIHSISPSSFAQRNKIRRKSFDGNDRPNEQDSSEYDSEVEIPVREYQSDTSYQSARLATPVNRISPDNITPGNRSNFNRSGSISTPQNLRAKPVQEGSTRVTLPLLMLVGVAVTVASMFNTTKVSNKVIYDESRFYNDINLLASKYNIDENAVLQMQTGISSIFERQDSGSFMFLYNSDYNNFNAKEFNMFMNDISNTASQYLRNETTPVHYTVVEAAALDMYGHSELISAFRDDLYRTGVMLVKHVDAIPSTLAMAFHYYCDEYNPLVKKSAIFFTLNLARCPAAGEKSIHAAIEKCLAQKWHSVPPDSIGPLLTRVVSVVIDLTKLSSTYQ